MEVASQSQDGYYEEGNGKKGEEEEEAAAGQQEQDADRGKRSRQNPFGYVPILTVHGGPRAARAKQQKYS